MAVHSSFAIVATLVYAATAVLVVVAKAHHMYIHRLTLYLAIAGTLHALAMGLEALPTDLSLPDNSTVAVRSGWYGACVLFGVLSQYFSFVKALAMLWICLYVFSLVVFQAQVKKRRHEACGGLVVILVPSLLTWEPLLHHSYGLAGAVCWITGDYERGNSSFGYVVKMAFFIVPHCLLSLAGMVLILAAILLLLKEAFKRERHLQKNHWVAMRQVLPLVIYPCVNYVVFLCQLAVGFSTLDSGSGGAGINNVVAACFIQSSSVVLLLSLFTHSSYRLLLRKRISYFGEGDEIVPIVEAMSAESTKCIDPQPLSR